LDRGTGPAGGAAPEDRCRRPQEKPVCRTRRWIADSKRYLQDCDRLQQSTTTDEELFNEMTKRYSDWESDQSWLMFGFPSFPEPMED
jgi:hypothetical protein